MSAKPLAWRLNLSAYRADQLRATIGVSAIIFTWLYARFAGNDISREDVFVALWYLKSYPTRRAAEVHWQQMGYAFSYCRVWAVIIKLGTLCQAYFEQFAPRQLEAHTNYVPALGSRVVGCVDVFPWYETGMKNRTKMQFQPKYAAIVAKVQVVCNLTGVPVYWSGPHLGVMSDLALFRMYHPPVPLGTVLLGDKGYQQSKDLPVLTPFKENSKEIKSKDAGTVNSLINWYRSTIEHLFGYLKRFLILGGTYRGKKVLDKASERRMRSALSIIMVLAYKQIRNSPLKDLNDLEDKIRRNSKVKAVRSDSEDDDPVFNSTEVLPDYDFDDFKDARPAEQVLPRPAVAAAASSSARPHRAAAAAAASGLDEKHSAPPPAAGAGAGAHKRPAAAAAAAAAVAEMEDEKGGWDDDDDWSSYELAQFTPPPPPPRRPPPPPRRASDAPALASESAAALPTVVGTWADRIAAPQRRLPQQPTAAKRRRRNRSECDEFIEFSQEDTWEAMQLSQAVAASLQAARPRAAAAAAGAGAAAGPPDAAAAAAAGTELRRSKRVRR